MAQLGTAADVFNAPASRYVADFVGLTNELMGTVSGAADGLLQMDTAIGRLLGHAPPPGPEPGQAVRVMFRPEHGRVAGGAGGGANVFAAEVERSIFLGSYVEYQLQTAGQSLAIRAMHGDALLNGHTINVVVDPNLTRIFVME